MTVKELKVILDSIDDRAEVALGVWLEQCRDMPATVDVDYIEHKQYAQADDSRLDIVTLVAKP